MTSAVDDARPFSCQILTGLRELRLLVLGSSPRGDDLDLHKNIRPDELRDD